MTAINKETFINRIVNLCLKSGLLGLPKEETNQHILLKSMTLLIGPSSTGLTQVEVDEKLKLWINQVSRKIEGLDHAALRRYLVDFGYLTRNSDGTNYQVVPGGPRPDLFEPEVDQIDLLASVQAAQEEMERRKREFMAKRGQNA